MTDIPRRLFMSTTWRDAEPGETIEAYIGAEEGALPFRTVSGHLLVVFPESENIARILASWHAPLATQVPDGPWELLLPEVPQSVGLCSPKVEFTFPGQAAVENDEVAA